MTKDARDALPGAMVVLAAVCLWTLVARPFCWVPNFHLGAKEIYAVTRTDGSVDSVLATGYHVNIGDLWLDGSEYFEKQSTIVCATASGDTVYSTAKWLAKQRHDWQAALGKVCK